MKCNRVSDEELAKRVMAEARTLREAEYPGCPVLLSVYDVLNNKQNQKTGAIVAGINQVMGTRYDSNVYGKWRRGERPVPREVEGYMRRQVLECVFGPSGGARAADLIGE